MEINQFLLGALENILGKGYKKARGNYAFHCPFCHHRKPKLEINLDINSPSFQCWECWVCQEKGRTIRSLLRHLRLSASEVYQVLQFVRKGEEEQETFRTNIVQLPEEYQSLELASKTSVVVNRFRNYLYNRGLGDDDFVRYGIGYCTSGIYADRVIIPSYGEDNCLNYFVARSLDANDYRKYLNPDTSRDIIFFENLVNWNEPIILCEGVFDAFAIRRNVVPLLGKQINKALMKKIIESRVPEIYVCLDSDALKASIKHCETFLNMGKKVYLVKPEAKDPNEQGFYSFTRQLQRAKELTFRDLIEYRLIV